MKKRISIAITVAIVIIVLSASILVFLNGKGNGPQVNATPTPTSTPTSEPIVTGTPTPTPAPTSTATQTVPHYTYNIVSTYPHDSNAFTEGLIYSDGSLYESTGLNGASSLRRVDLTTGTVKQQISLPYEYFGEGIATVNNTILQLTWQSNIGFIYDKNTFSLLGNFSYPTEGWGLTYDGKQLIMSDGTDHLYFLNPTTYQRTGQVQVIDGNNAVLNINELEYIKGDVYANIWQTNTIAIINPDTGQVKSWIDLKGLPAPSPNGNNVLNGIAYDQTSDRLFVTGKNWPNLYQIKLVP
jgi:glutaminyl-peptide cyclotransferase